MLKISFVIFATLAAITSADDDFQFVHCCGYAELMDHAVASKCHQNVTSGDHKEKFRQGNCHLNCIAREMNLVEGNSISSSKFMELVDKKVTDPEEQTFYKDKIKVCETKVEEMAKHHKGKDHDDSECSKKIFGIMMCLGHQVALECPAEKKIQSDACEKQRGFFKKMQENHHENHHEKHN